MDNSGTAIPTLYLLVEIGFAAAHAEPFHRKTSIPPSRLGSMILQFTTT